MFVALCAGVSNVGEDGNDLSPTDPTCTPFRPFYPSNSPYVLSVSSTFLTPNALPMCGEDITLPQTLALTCDQVRHIWACVCVCVISLIEA